MFRFLGLISREAPLAISKTTGVQSFTAFLPAIIGVINIPDPSVSKKDFYPDRPSFCRFSLKQTRPREVFNLGGKTRYDFCLFPYLYLLQLGGGCFWFFLMNVLFPKQQFITICRLKVKMYSK